MRSGRDVRHGPGHDVVLVDALADGQPGIALHLLDAQGDTVVLLIDPDDLDGDLVALLEAVADTHVPLPRDLAHVHQAVHGADVDEDAEVGQAADLALDDVALVHLFVELGPLLRGLLLDEGLPREDDAVLPAIRREIGRASCRERV